MKWISCLCLSLLVMFTFAQAEIEEEIVELGTVEEFSERINSEISSFSTLDFVRRVGRIQGTSSTMYFSIMEIDGILVYCIQPGIYAGTGKEYTVNYDLLDEQMKQKLFRITNVGYQNAGHEEDKWFVATQLAIWRALGFTQYSAKTMNGEVWDVSEEVAEIERMADSFGNSASFTGQTLNVDKGVPITVEDTHGVISGFEILSEDGLIVEQDGNRLTLTMTGTHKEKKIAGSKGLKTGGLVYARQGNQSVYMVTRTSEPVSYELKLKLKMGDVKVSKINEHGELAMGKHQFELLDEQGKQMEINGENTFTIENGMLEIRNQIPKGTYILKEVSTVYPYQLSKQEVMFEIDSETLNEVEFVNEFVETELTVVKKDEVTQQLLDGAEFTVSVLQLDGTWKIRTKGTAKNGEMKVSGLKYGDTIKVCEVKAPLGYLISEANCQIVKMLPAEQEGIELEFTNRRNQIPLQIVKKDKETKELLSGAMFSIQVLDEQGKWNEMLQLETNQGYTEEIMVNEGEKIQVCEIKAPQGYKLAENGCQEIVVQSVNKEKILMEFENEVRRLSLKIVKKDKQTHELLNNAIFEIQSFDQKSQSYKQGILLKTGGTFIYAGRKLAGQVVKVTADQGRNVILKECIVDDLGMIDVSEFGGLETVYVDDAAGNILELQAKKQDGMIEINDLEYGQRISVCEVMAPQGYQRQEKCQEIEMISEKDEIELEFENALRQIEIQIYKIDSEDKHLLNDAYFICNQENGTDVYGMTGRFLYQHRALIPVEFEVFADEACTELLFQGKTDETGEFIGECTDEEVYVRTIGQTEIERIQILPGGFSLGKLNYGDHLTVCEIIAPSGYQLQNECHQIEVNSNEDVMKIMIENKRIQNYEEVPSMGLY